MKSYLYRLKIKIFNLWPHNVRELGKIDATFGSDYALSVIYYIATRYFLTSDVDLTQFQLKSLVIGSSAKTSKSCHGITPKINNYFKAVITSNFSSTCSLLFVTVRYCSLLFGTVFLLKFQFNFKFAEEKIMSYNFVYLCVQLSFFFYCSELAVTSTATNVSLKLEKSDELFGGKKSH